VELVRHSQRRRRLRRRLRRGRRLRFHTRADKTPVSHLGGQNSRFHTWADKTPGSTLCSISEGVF
jgi:hypothetical protein